MKSVKNIIFDLGNVLLDLQLPKTEEAFRELLQEDFESAYLTYEAERLFERLEIGQLTPFEFVKGMNAATAVPLSDDEIIDAWNAMLKGIPAPRIAFLKALAKDYRIFLLSNTNAIHMIWLDEYLQDQHNSDLASFTGIFEKHYFSHDLNMRKPEARIFQHILGDKSLIPAETLFVDDLAENTQAAADLGIQIFTHNPESEIISDLTAFLQS